MRIYRLGTLIGELDPCSEVHRTFYGEWMMEIHMEKFCDYMAYDSEVSELTERDASLLEVIPVRFVRWRQKSVMASTYIHVKPKKIWEVINTSL